MKKLLFLVAIIATMFSSCTKTEVNINELPNCVLSFSKEDVKTKAVENLPKVQDTYTIITFNDNGDVVNRVFLPYGTKDISLRLRLESTKLLVVSGADKNDLVSNNYNDIIKEQLTLGDKTIASSKLIPIKLSEEEVTKVPVELTNLYSNIKLQSLKIDLPKESRWFTPDNVYIVNGNTLTSLDLSKSLLYSSDKYFEYCKQIGMHQTGNPATYDNNGKGIDFKVYPNNDKKLQTKLVIAGQWKEVGKPDKSVYYPIVINNGVIDRNTLYRVNVTISSEGCKTSDGKLTYGNIDISVTKTPVEVVDINITL